LTLVAQAPIAPDPRTGRTAQTCALRRRSMSTSEVAGHLDEAAVGKEAALERQYGPHSLLPTISGVSRMSSGLPSASYGTEADMRPSVPFSTFNSAPNSSGQTSLAS
jgi:hypothetical protein